MRNADDERFDLRLLAYAVVVCLIFLLFFFFCPVVSISGRKKY